METAKKVWQGKTLTYGLKSGDIKGELIDGQTINSWFAHFFLS